MLQMKKLAGMDLKNEIIEDFELKLNLSNFETLHKKDLKILDDLSE